MPPARPPGTPLPVVVDTDPGIDDVLALLLALESPELDVRAIVTVHGNATLAHATANARRLEGLVGRPLPIVAGADRPLARPVTIARETHGPRGLGHAVGEDEPEIPVEPDPGALLRVLAAESAPVTLVTLGPLTNLAHALLADAPLVRRRVAAHVAMAGTLRARGTQTPLAEFNVWCDPEAAQLVLDAGLGTRWVGLDATRQLTLSHDEVERLGATARDRWLRDALRFYVEFHRQYEQFEGCVINDPLAVAAVLRPGALEDEEVEVMVDLSDGVLRGRTYAAPGGRPARFAVRVDVPAVRALLDERVFGGAR
jgi:inosine-uridine nucleoside N-ribohydrolase